MSKSGLAIVLAGLGALLFLAHGSSGASVSAGGGCYDPAHYSWSGTVISYGIRDFTVEFCGPGSADLDATLDWKGRKNVSLVLIEPDGTIHSVTGQKSAGQALAGPLASGEWTLLVRNLSPSNVKFDATLTIE